MSPTDQQLTIAAEIGWYNFETCLDGSAARGTPPWHEPSKISKLKRIKLPDFLNDLNAIHSVVLSRISVPGFCGAYSYALEVVCGVSGSAVRSKKEEFLIQNATAAQCSKAFLVATGKWVNELPPKN